MEDFERRRSAFKSRVAGLQSVQIEVKKSKQTNKRTLQTRQYQTFARFTLHTKITIGIS
jgi:hypothetical protein